MTEKIIVAGAGIGGLTLALALMRRGLDVTVIKQFCMAELVEQPARHLRSEGKANRQATA